MTGAGSVDGGWQVRGSYFEACNCEAICPCRSVGGRDGGPSSWGECFGTLSWNVHDGHFGAVDLSARMVVMSMHYSDRTELTTPWDVVLYVDLEADDALTAIFLGRAGGSVARLYGPAIGEVHAVRRAEITVEHVAPRKRIDVVGYLTSSRAAPRPNPATFAAVSRVSITQAPSSTARS